MQKGSQRTESKQVLYGKMFVTLRLTLTTFWPVCHLKRVTNPDSDPIDGETNLLAKLSFHG